MEHEERADELEREADKLEEHSEEVGQRIEDTRSEWETKQQDQAVPGAQSYEALHPGEDNEEEDGQVSEREESDQLPEEGPSEQVPEDESGGDREDAHENPGVPGEDEQSTGNPDAAGSEE
jgi:hypothetical protein